MKASGKNYLLLLVGSLFLVTLIVEFVYNQWNSKRQLAGETDISLLSAADAIANLHRLYAVFTNPEQREGLSAEQRQQVETEFRTLLAIVPLIILVPQMEKYSIAIAYQLQGFEDPKQFVRRVSEVAMNGIITTEKAETTAHGAVSFKRLISELEDRARFTAQDKTIFAEFDLSAYRETRVLVKWFEAETGLIVPFKQFDIADSDSNHIWIYDETGFRSGHYQVEVYRVNQSVQLPARGDYRVES